MLNGLFALFDKGLESCDGGFGFHGCGKQASGSLQYRPRNSADRAETLSELSTLLTGGRFDSKKIQIVQDAISTEPDPEKAWRMAAKLMVTSPEYHTTSLTDSSTELNGQPSPSSITGTAGSTSYKAVIHLQLMGGLDSFNMLAPYHNCTRLSREYKDIRGNIALKNKELLPVGATSQPCSTFGIHHQFPLAKRLYDDADLLFLANVGVLTEPVTKANFGLKTETQVSTNRFSLLFTSVLTIPALLFKAFCT